MSNLAARQKFTKTPGEVRNVRLGLKDLLDSGELLTGTPTITVSPSGLTTASPLVNVGTITIDDVSYSAGQAITFTISGGTAGTVYELLVSCDTDASQTLQRYVYVAVETSASASGEPTVGGDYDAIRRRLGDYLGKSMDPDDWSQNDSDRIDDFIDAGYRQLLQPPPLPNERVAHSWSYLRPVASLTLWGTVSGTVSGVPSYSASTGKSTITATTAKFFATMVGKTLTFGTSGTTWTVTDYTSATVLQVSGDASGEASGQAFTVTADGDYQMPDDFGGIVQGSLYFTSDSNSYHPMRIVGEGAVLAARQLDTTVAVSGITPTICAFVPINSTSGSAGQRVNMLVWPAIDAGELHVARFSYHALQNRLSLARPFALGGAAHYQTLLQSCLAMAEQYANDVRGVHWQSFIERLAASVHHDRATTGAKNFGYVGDPGMNGGCDLAQVNVVTYTRNGVTYP